jgi:hypothetical protein
MDDRDQNITPDETPDLIPGPEFDWYTYHGNVQDDAEIYQQINFVHPVPAPAFMAQPPAPVPNYTAMDSRIKARPRTEHQADSSNS